MRSPHFRSMRITEDVWCYAAEEGVTGRGQLEKVNSKNARRVADDGARASSRQRAERKVARGKRHSTNQGTTEFVLKTQDCILGMRDLSPESVDIVVTSPPYNLGIKYTNYNDSRNRDEYLVWSLEWANEVRRVLKKDGSFFLNLGAAPSNPLVPHELIVELKKLFKLQNTFHWIKSITVQSKPGDPMSVGHFKPLHSSRFVNDCHEYVFHLTKEGKTQIDRLALGVPYSDKSNIKRWSHTKGRDLRCRGNNWFVPYKTIVSRSRQRPHPATFPAELAINCIKLHGADAASVMLDPFLGIGNAAIAAKVCRIGRFVGFDVDSEYVRVARGNVRAAPDKIDEPAEFAADPQLF